MEKRQKIYIPFLSLLITHSSFSFYLLYKPIITLSLTILINPFIPLLSSSSSVQIHLNEKKNYHPSHILYCLLKVIFDSSENFFTRLSNVENYNCIS